MGWRDGCAPRPAVAEGAEQVDFDFDGADLVGQRLDGLRRSVDDALGARATAEARLADWAGGHREAYDGHRAEQEGVLGGDRLEAEIARLRVAWDEAVRAQVRSNRLAAAADPAAGHLAGPRPR